MYYHACEYFAIGARYEPRGFTVLIDLGKGDGPCQLPAEIGAQVEFLVV